MVLIGISNLIKKSTLLPASAFIILIFSFCAKTVVYQGEKFVQFPCGLLYKDIVKGKGVTPERGQWIHIRYNGCSEDGTNDFQTPLHRIIYRSYLPKQSTNEILSKAVTGMKIDGRRIVIIPPFLQIGQGWIPASVKSDKAVVLDIYLINVDGRPKMQ